MGRQPVAVIKTPQRMSSADVDSLRRQFTRSLTLGGTAPVVLPNDFDIEYLPGLNGELIDVTGYCPEAGRRREPVAPPLPRQWYPMDVAFTVALATLLMALLWLVLR